MPRGGVPASGAELRRDLMSLAVELDFSEFNFQSERILPSLKVANRSDYWPVLPREVIAKIGDTKRANNGSFARDEWEWSRDNYFTAENGWEEPVDPVEAMAYADFIDIEAVSMELAVQKLMLGRESNVAQAVFNTTTFASGNDTQAITNEWDDATNATPWADINNAALKVRAKTMLKKSALSLIITDDNLGFALKTNEIKGSVQYTEAIPTMSKERKRQFLAEYLDIKEIVVVDSFYDYTGLKLSSGFARFWSNEYMMLAKLSNGGPSPKDMSLGRQPVWQEYADDYVLESYPEPKVNKEIIRAREYRGTKVLKDYGCLLTNAKTTVDANTNV